MFKKLWQSWVHNVEVYQTKWWITHDKTYSDCNICYFWSITFTLQRTFNILVITVWICIVWKHSIIILGKIFNVRFNVTCSTRSTCGNPPNSDLWNDDPNVEFENSIQHHYDYDKQKTFNHLYSSSFLVL